MQRTLFSSVAASVILTGAVIGASSSPASAQQASFTAKLQGFSEVPSISTTATGSFRATLSPDGQSLQYTLSHSGLSSPITQSHIHFGQVHTTGSVMVFLCQTATNPDPTGLAPQCVQEGTVTGTLTSANIIQAGSQGIGAGEFEEFVLALQGRSGYVNVHSMSFAPGEIRGQVQ